MQEFTDMIIGRKPLLEAFRSYTQPIDRVFVLSGAQGEEIEEILQLAKEYNVTIKKVPKEKLDRLSRSNHQGVVAMLSAVDTVDYIAMLETALDTEHAMLVALDGITDVRNFGGIARSAFALGAQGILIPDSHSVSLSGDALKASAGALQHLKVSKTANLHIALKDAKMYGYQILIADGKANTQVSEYNFKQPTILVMGSEEDGVSKQVEKIADTRVSIPMAGNFDSLNVGVSAGIILYERSRQLLQSAE